MRSSRPRYSRCHGPRPPCRNPPRPRNEAGFCLIHPDSTVFSYLRFPGRVRKVPCMKPVCAPRLRRSRGFTLLELLVVMVIIGLLAGFVAPRYFAQVGKSQVKAAKAQIDALDKAIEQFRLDMNRLPTTEEGLNALNVAPAN